MIVSELSGMLMHVSIKRKNKWQLHTYHVYWMDTAIMATKIHQKVNINTNHHAKKPNPCEKKGKKKGTVTHNCFAEVHRSLKFCSDCLLWVTLQLSNY
uniref:Uncharacterized protein n=1 Tax=Pyxicephalus adspersus TaxID=30357 RepID=A0AAV2ZHF8_PYXAD|nr:TPA: hypothetical protein GDO54_005269 [Pyxicephalus adspersus]